MNMKHVFTGLLCAILVACSTKEQEPLPQEEPKAVTRISLSGAFEPLEPSQDMRLQLGLQHKGWAAAPKMAFGHGATHKAVLILRNKATRETYRKVVNLSVEENTANFKLKSEPVFDTENRPFSAGDWSVMVVTAGLDNFVESEYKVRGQTLFEFIEVSAENHIATIGMPFASAWTDLTVQPGRKKADASKIVLRPFGVAFQVKIENGTTGPQTRIPLNALGASSNYIPQDGYFDLSDRGLPALGTKDFPRWNNGPLLNSGEAGVTRSDRLSYISARGVVPRLLFTRPLQTYYVSFPVGEGLPRVANPFLKLGIKAGEPDTAPGGRVDPSEERRYKTFWTSTRGDLQNLRGKVIPVVAVITDATIAPAVRP